MATIDDAALLIARKEYAQAVDVLQRLVPSDDHAHAAILDRRAEAQAKLGAYEAAVKDGLELIRFRPSWNAGYLRVGEALRGAKRLDEALAYLKRGNEVGTSVQLRMLIRAVETDRQISAASKAAVPAVADFHVPDVSECAALVDSGVNAPQQYQHSSAPRDHRPAAATAASPAAGASSSKATSAGTAPASKPARPGASGKSSAATGALVFVAAIVIATVAIVAFLPRLLAVAAAVAGVIGIHTLEASRVVSRRLCGVPLSVWTSAYLCFVLTWVAPMWE